MRRNDFDRLRAWNADLSHRKPLVILGARQVGKTWLMEHFAAEVYPTDTVSVDLRDNVPLRASIAESSVDAQGILRLISTATGRRIEPGKTLLLIDEIQESPKTLEALKYFHDKLPQLAVMAAGSLLGIAVNRERDGRKRKLDKSRVSFPVGKVSFLEVHPMTFGEFLDAIGESVKRERLEALDWPTVTSFHDSFCDLLKRYYFVGGMPEAVASYAKDGDLTAVRKIQLEILKAYDLDFAKHAPAGLLAKIRLLWNAIPAQLAKENKKLVYTALRSGARARDYEVALQWLDDAGMIRQIHRVTRPGMPLKSYEDFSAFKLYAHDVGLLGAMSEIPSQVLLEGHELFTHFKGAFTEQYVAEELVASGVHPYYWSTDEGMAEVEFVVQGATAIYPLEVKAKRNLQAKSLASYDARFKPDHCLRSSLAKHGLGARTDDLPLYALAPALRPYMG